MGNKVACARKIECLRRKAPILQVRVFGLKGSGKKSIVAFLKRGMTVLEDDVVKDEGDMQWITHKKLKMLFWVSEHAVDKDVMAQPGGVRALIYVVDGSDSSHLPLAREHLLHQLQHIEGNPHLLIYLNKCDKPSYVFLEEAHYALGLDKITDRHVRIYASSAATGEGIREGLDWLCSKFYVKKGVYLARRDTL